MQTTNMPPISKQPTLTRRHVVSLNLTTASYSVVEEAILQAAATRSHGMVCFANVHMTMEAKQKPDVAKAVNSADWVVTDGVPLMWALKGLYGVQQERIAGMDMMPSLLAEAAERKLPVFFYGSTPDVLARCVAVCAERYPGLSVAGTLSPPFRPLTAEEDEATAQQITDSGAQMVFVALGCPKQELWMARMRDRIPAVLLGIGGALPLLVGEQRRAPLWIRNMGMEWAARLIQEPRRLFKRYAVTNSLYLWHLTGQFITRKE